MDIKSEIERIDNYFNHLTIEEFEEVLIRNGAKIPTNEFENNVAISLQKAILEVKNNKIDFVSWEEFWKYIQIE
jgi:hypothetical protein